MPRYVATVHSSKPVTESFDYLADFSSVREWDETAVSARMLGEKPGLGTEFEVVVRFAGRELPFVYRTTTYERPERIVVRAESSSVVSEDTISFRPSADGGSEVTYDADLRPKGLLKLADPILALIFRRLGDSAKRGLERELNR